MTDELVPPRDFKSSARGRGRLTAARRRQVEALRLRSTGLTYEQIGQHLGYSTRGAWGAVQKALDSERRELALQVLELELVRLDELMIRPYAHAIQGDTRAIGTVLNIMDRRIKLLGLDRPRAGDKERDAVSLLQTIQLQLNTRPDTYQPVERHRGGSADAL